MVDKKFLGGTAQEVVCLRQETVRVAGLVEGARNLQTTPSCPSQKIRESIAAFPSEMCS